MTKMVESMGEIEPRSHEDTKVLEPELRFSGFLAHWKPIRLLHITQWSSGGTPSKSEPEYWGGDIPWISASSMKSKFLSDSDLKITAAGSRQSSKLAPENSILLLVRGSMLYKKIPVGITAKNVAFNQDVKCVQVTNETSVPFVYYWLKHSENKLLNMVVGTGIGAGKLETSDLQSMKINLPSIEEQQKIADFLSSVDKKIEQLTEKHRLLTQYKKGVMQQIFTQQICFKDNQGNDYPEWEEKSLGSLGETYNGLTGKTSEDFGSGYPFITYKQIFDNSQIEINKFASVKVEEGEKQNCAKYGDVFFTTSSETPKEVGFASVLLSHVENLYLNSFCFGYRIYKQDDFSPKFARWLFGSNDFRRAVVRLAQGSTRYNMSKVQLMKVAVKLPCVEEQQKIANFLTSIDHKIDQAWSTLEQTKAFKKGLLQKMFV